MAKGFSALVLAVGLNLPDKRVDPDYWLRSGFESPCCKLVVSLFLDPISCVSFVRHNFQCNNYNSFTDSQADSSKLVHTFIDKYSKIGLIILSAGLWTPCQTLNR